MGMLVGVGVLGMEYVYFSTVVFVFDLAVIVDLAVVVDLTYVDECK